MSELETRTIAKVMKRLVPFLIVCYFVAYLDRVNVGFAKLTMDKQLGLSETMFGFGSGIFFVAYFFFEVPSNLALEKFGARRWIARIMVTWGILSGAMAAIPAISAATGISGEYTFYAIRTLLGAAEAGFFPGIIFFLTLWFPALYRGRIIGMFMAAIPMSSVLGAPLSGYLLGFDGVAGLAGWQWLYVIEAAPALVLAVAVLVYLTDRPGEATWLAQDERNWLVSTLANETAHRKASHDFSVLQALMNPRVLALAFVYFGAVAANYGVGFFLPTIVKGFGLTNAMTGWVTAIPYAVGAIGMVWWSARSDRLGERKNHTIITLLIAAVGIIAATMTEDPLLKMLAFSFSAFGVFAVLPVFWTLPTAFLSGASAAAGIAAINSIGNLSGFAGPFAMGYIKDATGSFNGGLLLISGCVLIAMVIVMVLGHDHSLEKAPVDPKLAAD
ncbi:MAG: MFS transporter [Acetobacteraceae bacterium]|nr:MFS transporter [Acetobacteraceae bacterium]